MFGIGVPELILILIIGLVVFGPGKLPEIGRAVGKTLNEFKDYLEDAEITLIYTEDPFLGTHGRAAEIVRFMNEDGSITPIIAQEGCTLYEYHAGIRD